MRTPTLAFCVTAVLTAGAATLSAERRDDGTALMTVLQAAGDRVLTYVARAQHLVCLEVVHLQPLTSSWSANGFGRTVESELHLLWSPGDDGALTSETQALRQVLRVNGREPRSDDRNNCTTPEQETREPQPLSMLLPSEREDYSFRMAGMTRLDGRTAVMVDFRELKKPTVDAKMVDGRDDCVSYNIEGGVEGRIWIDAASSEVLRVDQRLAGMIDVRLPKEATRLPGASMRWTIERMDTTIRFKTVTFKDPDETLMLPVTVSSLHITQGSATPRLRTTTEYSNYKRFITSGRIVGQ